MKIELHEITIKDIAEKYIDFVKSCDVSQLLGRWY